MFWIHFQDSGAELTVENAHILQDTVSCGHCSGGFLAAVIYLTLWGGSFSRLWWGAEALMLEDLESSQEDGCV